MLRRIPRKFLKIILVSINIFINYKHFSKKPTIESINKHHKNDIFIILHALFNYLKLNY